MMLILRACLVWLLAAPAPLHASCAALYITVWHWKRAPAQLLTRQELEEPVIGGFARLRHSASDGAGAIGSSTKDALKKRRYKHIFTCPILISTVNVNAFIHTTILVA